MIDKFDIFVAICNMCVVKPVCKIKLDLMQTWQIILKDTNSDKNNFVLFFWDLSRMIVIRICISNLKDTPMWMCVYFEVVETIENI